MLLFISQFLLLLSIFPLLSIVVAYIMTEPMVIWIITYLFIIFLGILFKFIAPFYPKSPILFNFLCLFIVLLIITPIPLLLSNNFIVDSIFNSISAVTTSGLIFGTLNSSLLFWLASLQWLSGLGFICLTIIAVSHGFNKSFLSYYPFQIVALNNLDFWSLLKALALPIKVYIFMSFLCFIGLWLDQVPTFSCLIYSLSSISTGGIIDPAFPIDRFSNISLVLILLFSCLGALNFTLYCNNLLSFKYQIMNYNRYTSYTKLWFKIFNDPEFRLFIYLLLIAFTLIFLHQGFISFEIVFYALSALTTSGFVLNPGSVYPLSEFLIFLLLLLAFIGGGSFSSSSGIKLFRFRLLVLYYFFNIKKNNILYYAKENLIDNDQIVETDMIISTSIFFLIMLSSFFVFLLFFSFSLHNISFLQLFILTVTSFTNTSSLLPILGFDLSLFTLHIKIIYFLAMLIGRFEVMYLFILGMPYFLSKN